MRIKSFSISSFKSNKKFLILLFGNLILVSFILVVLFFWKNILSIVSLFICLIAFNFWYFSSIQHSKNSELEMHRLEFVQFISFFQIFLKNGCNVYNALKKASDFSSLFLKQLIDGLLESIDRDKTIIPFIQFAKHFSDATIEKVVISIYQMIDEGNNSKYLTKFNLLFERISEEKMNQSFYSYQRKLDSITLFPLVGAAIITISISFGIISMLGDMINVV